MNSVLLFKKKMFNEKMIIYNLFSKQIIEKELNKLAKSVFAIKEQNKF